MLSECSDILIKYGGHERAAGLSAEYENIEELERRLNRYADDNNIEIEDDKIYNIECEVYAENITCGTVREFEILEPFGNDNPVPLFAICGCKIINIAQIGENKHTKIEFMRGRFSFEAVYFNMETDELSVMFNKYDIVDIACSIGINEFMNKEKVQYVIRDMRLNEKYLREYLDEKENYDRFINNQDNSKINSGDIPDREDFKSVYIFLVNNFKKDVLYESGYNTGKIHSRYFDYSLKTASRFKFRIILDIFCETGIIYIEHDFDKIKKIKINNNSSKTDLDNSEIYKRLKE
jgi:single-stranded-DNA-specific exonuclease